MSLLYFAYGSNLASPRILAAERVPEARLVGTAVLRGYSLEVHKRGDDGSGKCDVVPAAEPGSVVHGALWSLEVRALRTLDRVEGVGRGYERHRVEVETGERRVSVETYRAMADFVDAGVVPFDWYMAYVVAGAEEHGLPLEYRRRLSTIAVREDPDSARRARNLALLGR